MLRRSDGERPTRFSRMRLLSKARLVGKRAGKISLHTSRVRSAAGPMRYKTLLGSGAVQAAEPSRSRADDLNVSTSYTACARSLLLRARNFLLCLVSSATASAGVGAQSL
eukprot:4267048-Pleurochrysis_carterae.AAC.1